MNSRIYKLKRMLWAPPLIVTFFGYMAYFFYRKAMFSYQGMLLLSVIQIPPYLAKYAYWFFCIFSVGFAALGILLFFTSLQGARVVTVFANSISVPKLSFRGIKYVDVPFGSIQNVELYKAGNGVFINVRHAQGKFSLARSVFQSQSEFQEVYSFLTARSMAISSLHRSCAGTSLSNRDEKNDRMLGHIRRNLFETREGKIFLLASALYLAIGTLAKLVPSAIPISSFYAWLFQFMPVLLALFYINIGGLKKSFESGSFNTTIILVVAALPAFMKCYGLIAH